MPPQAVLRQPPRLAASDQLRMLLTMRKDRYLRIVLERGIFDNITHVGTQWDSFTTIVDIWTSSIWFSKHEDKIADVTPRAIINGSSTSGDHLLRRWSGTFRTNIRVVRLEKVLEKKNISVFSGTILITTDFILEFDWSSYPGRRTCRCPSFFFFSFIWVTFHPSWDLLVTKAYI